MKALKSEAPQLVVTMTAEQLERLLERASEKALAEAIANQAKEVLDLRECAALLKRNTKTVTRLVETRGLPCHYISGNEPRFRRTEVLEWLSHQPNRRMKDEES